MIAAASVVVATLTLPLVVLVAWVFWGGRELGLFQLTPTFEWLGAIFTNEEYLGALLRSLGISAAVTSICAIAIAILGYQSIVLKVWQRWLLYVCASGVALFPTVLYALAIRTFVAPVLQSTFGANILADVVFFTATGFLFSSIFASRSRDVYISTAQTLGATPWRIFRRVYIPLHLDALVRTSALIFAMCMDESVFSLLVLRGDEQTVPRYLWNQRAYVSDPTFGAAALGALITVGIVFLIYWAARRGRK